MNHIGFTSHAEMTEHLRQAASHGLHPVQAALTYGATWVQFHDMKKRIIRFGRVLTQHDLVDLMFDQGHTVLEVESMMAGADDTLASGIAYSRYFDRVTPEGKYVPQFKAHVWPIEESLYLHALTAEWKIERLPMEGKINLEAAFRGHRGHVHGKG